MSSLSNTSTIGCVLSGTAYITGRKASPTIVAIALATNTEVIESTKKSVLPFVKDTLVNFYGDWRITYTT